MGTAHPIDKVVSGPVIRKDLAALAASEPEEAWFKSVDASLIVAVGELSARRDHATLIRAFARARIQRPLKLAILGEGRGLGRLEALASELGVSSDVHLPGFVPDPYPWIARADVFAHSSRWEGLAVVLMEALAFGALVVATACPSGTRELLDDRHLGKLVSIGDDTALARGIVDTLNTSEDRNALRHAAEPYHVMRSARAYLDAMGFNSID
jgi:glycosyltransferase involved in cell wall biosynthesis